MNFQIPHAQREFVRKNLKIIGLVAILLVVSIILIPILSHRESSHDDGLCKVSQKRPSRFVEKPSASTDNSALVKLSGYIQYVAYSGEDLDVFLPLKIHTVEDKVYNDSRDEPIGRILIIDMDCVELTIHYFLRRLVTEFGEASVKISPVVGIHNETISCNLISRPFIPWIPSNTHYDCEHKWTCLCTRTNGPDLERWFILFVFDSFEFEVNGDRKKIEKHEFSKPKEMCDR